MNSIYAKTTIEFVTVGVEYCRALEQCSNATTVVLAGQMTKILPLLYLKATLLPETDHEDIDYYDIERFVTESDYAFIQEQIQQVLGSYDLFLDVFHEEINRSDTPIAVSISEYLSDVYQEIKDFVSLYALRQEEQMEVALGLLTDNFVTFWGQRLLGALRALHTVAYNKENQEVDNSWNESDSEY